MRTLLMLATVVALFFMLGSNNQSTRPNPASLAVVYSDSILSCLSRDWLGKPRLDPTLPLTRAFVRGLKTRKGFDLLYSLTMTEDTSLLFFEYEFHRKLHRNIQANYGPPQDIPPLYAFLPERKFRQATLASSSQFLA